MTDDGAFDAASLRRILALDEPWISSYDPSQPTASADRLRVRSYRVRLAIFFLAVSVTLAVCAQASRWRPDKYGVRLGGVERDWWLWVGASGVIALVSVVCGMVWVAPLLGT